jgi:hypothetical protein
MGGGLGVVSIVDGLVNASGLGVVDNGLERWSVGLGGEIVEERGL